MSDEVLRSKVKDLLEKFERVFQTEWRKTKLNLDHEMVEHFIDPKGTFLEPDGTETNIPWASRDELLVSYRSLLAELGEGSASAAPATTTSPVSPIQNASKESYVDAVSDTEQEAPIKEDPKPAIPTPPSNTPSTLTKSHAIPKPNTSSQPIPLPGAGEQWPGVVTGPVAVGPASAQGFPNPFAAAINEPEAKTPSPMAGPDSDTPAIKQDPAEIRAIACKEKFAYLLEGVESEVIRDFILLEGTNSGTGKPTVIIYTLEQIWLEFAFDYAEGSRILNKYPQRDPELIEFMKSTGHTS